MLVGPGLYATAGALCAGELNERGEIHLSPLERPKIEKRANTGGTWRWYGLYRGRDDDPIRVRLDTNHPTRSRNRRPRQ